VEVDAQHGLDEEEQNEEARRRGYAYSASPDGESRLVAQLQGHKRRRRELAGCGLEIPAAVSVTNF
jgi:hypothetical protein